MSDDCSSTDSSTARSVPDAGSSGEVVVYSTTWCPDCRRAKRVFASMGVPYREINIETHPDGARIVQALNSGMKSVPTIIFPDGSVLVEPSARELEAKLRQAAS